MTTRIPGSAENISERFYNQVSESIKLVFDLTSRIDERVKMLVERQDSMDDRIDKFMELQQGITNRIIVLETKDNGDVKKDIEEMKNKIQVLELKTEGISQKTNTHDSRMNQVFDLILKGLFMVIGGYLMWKIGIAPPITPP